MYTELLDEQKTDKKSVYHHRCNVRAVFNVIILISMAVGGIFLIHLGINSYSLKNEHHTIVENDLKENQVGVKLGTGWAGLGPSKGSGKNFIHIIASSRDGFRGDMDKTIQYQLTKDDTAEYVCRGYKAFLGSDEYKDFQCRHTRDNCEHTCGELCEWRNDSCHQETSCVCKVHLYSTFNGWNSDPYLTLECASSDKVCDYYLKPENMKKIKSVKVVGNCHKVEFMDQDESDSRDPNVDRNGVEGYEDNIVVFGENLVNMPWDLEEDVSLIKITNKNCYRPRNYVLLKKNLRCPIWSHTKYFKLGKFSTIQECRDSCAADPVCSSIGTFTWFGETFNQQGAFHEKLGECYSAGVRVNECPHNWIKTDLEEIRKEGKVCIMYPYQDNCQFDTESTYTILVESVAVDDLNGWNKNKRTNCGGHSVLGGYGVFGAGDELIKKYTLPTRKCNANINFNFMKIDSWDHEDIIIYISQNGNDLEVYRERQIRENTSCDDDDQPCGKKNLCGNGDYSDTIINIGFDVHDIEGTHFDLKITTTLNSGPTDESWGIYGLVIKFLCRPDLV